MSNFNHSIKPLEYDKIKKLLVDVCPTEGSKTKAYNLMPSNDYDYIKKLLVQTSDAKALMGRKGFPSFGHVTDVYPSLDRAEKGAVLSTRELLDIGNILRTARSLIDYIDDKNHETTSLDEIFGRLYSLRQTEDKIYRIILSEDTISDDASPALSDIRRKKRNVSNKIKDILSQYTSGKYTKYLQENIITQRNGRYVVPVKSEYKNDVPGLSHDISASGATIFIEPMAIVEANNNLRELEALENHEIDKILTDLTNECLSQSAMILLNYQNITELAFIFAKGELSYKMDAAEPHLSTNFKLQLDKARHPLIDKKVVVPISLSLGYDFDTLIITGPNTGGKTVSLKTVGLLSMMVQSGLHIPASDTSIMPIFNSIFADIGDEQSIEQSLSTFSSHMTNIIKIINDAEKGSLVLYDELCTGTDPIEGAALAEAIIEKTRILGALTIATTHYAELKEYALNQRGVTNASCEFDVSTLKPTYKLVVGTPGKSNAFAISQKLGLNQDIINNAEKLISSHTRTFEDTIGKLEEARVKMEASKHDTELIHTNMEKMMAEATKEAEKIKKEAEIELERARKKAQSMVESAKASSDFIFDKVNELKKQAEKGSYNSNMDTQKNEIKKALRKADNKANPIVEIKPKNYKPPRPYKKGDLVLVVNINSQGTIEKDPDKDGNVNVKVGFIGMKTTIDNLMLITGTELEKTIKKTEKKESSTQYRRTVRDDFSSELNILGMTGEEGKIAVDKYLDECKLVKLTTARIVHGKGTGALRKAVHEFLKNDKRVKSYRLGIYGEGDSGVTVVELK